MRFLDFLLLVLVLLLPQSSCEEAEPLFRYEGSAIELGYCFGVDYIVVYRSGPEGDQLLGNSSADHTPIAPPADLQGRIRINNDKHLLGLQISDLRHEDSGTYRRECWQNNMRVSNHTQTLTVCTEEVSSVEILKREDGTRTVLRCNHTSSGTEWTTVRWFREKFPSYKMTLFLDSSESQHVLLEELQGLVEVREGGTLLLLDSTVFESNHHFYCVVMRGHTCLTFQNMFLPDRSESRMVFSSRGDRVVFDCPAEGKGQLWETPLGKMDRNSTQNKFMFLRLGEKHKDFSLVIPEASEEHSGDYSCVSSSLELQYLLVLCPKQETREHLFMEGTAVSLECNVSTERPHRFQWYRLDPSGQHKLIPNSNDFTAPVPDDLIGRLVLSGNGSLLTITDLEEGHEGVYWCVVFRGSEVDEEEEGEYDYTTTDYTEEYEGEDGDLQWPDSSFCVSKQETRLVFKSPSSSTRGTGEPSEAPEPPDSGQGLVGAVVGTVVAVVLVALVVGVAVVLKRRANNSQRPHDPAAPNATNNSNLRVDPECTDAMLPK